MAGGMPLKKRRPMAEMNVVPYIDVMLVLLVIFMITAPLLQQGVKVDLPKSDNAEPVPPEKKDQLILTINKDGDFILDASGGGLGDNAGHPIDEDKIVPLASEILKARPDTMVLVGGDNKVPYGRVMKGLMLLREAGAPNVNLLTDPPSEPAPPRRKK